MKVLEQTQTEHGLTLKLEGVAGRAYRLHLRRNTTAAPKVMGADMLGDEITVRFADGGGYQQKTVELRW